MTYLSRLRKRPLTADAQANSGAPAGNIDPDADNCSGHERDIAVPPDAGTQHSGESGRGNRRARPTA
jgi:hypothetical protein